MRLAIIALVAAIGWLQYQPALPPVWPCLLGGVLVAGIALPLRRGRRLLVPLAAAALALGYASWRAEQRLVEWLPHALEQQPLQITGTVLGLPQPSRYGPRLRFAVEQAPTGVPPQLLLNDYARPASDWQPGQRWQLTVKLKRPHGSANPGGMDYEAWLLGEGIGATGSIAPRDRQLLADFVPSPTHYLHAGRSWLAQRIRHALGSRPYAEVIVALVVGEQAGIPQAHWQLFRNTGITHLVSISGLHVTLVASLVGGFVGWLWGRSPRLLLGLPRRKAALLAGVLAALAYSLLAGFAVPTQRTFYMLAVAAIALMSGRTLAVSTIWLLALGITVLLDPWAVLSAGFWLSYLTVGAMLWALAGQQGEATGWRARLWQWGAVQWAATLGSLPLLVLIFQQMPLTSPLANALAIPMISALVTPLALLGSLEPSGSLLRLGHDLLQLTLWLIQPLAQPAWVWSQAVPAVWLLLPAALATAMLLAPRGMPAKPVAALLLLPLLLPPLTPLAEGSYRATVFDVGQGLAVLLETRQHRLLFDTGAEGGGGRVVPAALRASGVARLETLLLSHDDNDHIGAAPAVLASLPVGQLLGVAPHAGGLPPLAPQPALQPCQAGEQWHWDGVDFALLNPPAGQQGKASDNALGCVLRVSAAGGSLLIPADIGRREEARLLAENAPLKADVLIMPHHGSAGSSSADFVAAVAPRLAIATAGYLNSFHHPRPEVIRRYEAGGATVWRSDRDGAVRLQFDPAGWQAERWRASHPRYWSEPLSPSKMVAITRLPPSR